MALHCLYNCSAELFLFVSFNNQQNICKWNEKIRRVARQFHNLVFSEEFFKQNTKEKCITCSTSDFIINMLFLFVESRNLSSNYFRGIISKQPTITK